MPKIFDRHDSEIGRIVRVNEDRWFKDQQGVLLQLANTDYGRDLLCIPKGYGKIFKIGKNHISHSPRMVDGVLHYDWDFRIGAKWANVIRFRWEEILGALMWQDANRFILPAVRSKMMMTAAFGGAYFPDPSVEVTSVDGSVGIDAQNAVYGTVRSAAGSFASDAAASVLVR